MTTERDIDAIATWKRGESADRHSGDMREPFRCYTCGEDFSDQPFVDNDRHTFCSQPCLDAWIRR